MLELNASVQLILIQFSFTNHRFVPSWIPSMEEETSQESKKRKNRVGVGSLIIPPTENCSLGEIPQNLTDCGYRMFDAVHQERINQKNCRQTYQMVRFQFSKECPQDPTFPANIMQDALVEMCLLAFWRIRVFLNPYFQKDEVVPEKNVVSINLEVRKARFQGDGKPITCWKRDAEDNKIGLSPIPLEPDHFLVLKDNFLQLI